VPIGERAVRRRTAELARAKAGFARLIRPWVEPMPTIGCRSQAGRRLPSMPEDLVIIDTQRGAPG
jgi:hypothetical protein